MEPSPSARARRSWWNQVQSESLESNRSESWTVSSAAATRRSWSISSELSEKGNGHATGLCSIMTFTGIPLLSALVQAHHHGDLSTLTWHGAFLYLSHKCRASRLGINFRAQLATDSALHWWGPTGRNSQLALSAVQLLHTAFGWAVICHVRHHRAQYTKRRRHKNCATNTCSFQETWLITKGFAAQISQPGLCPAVTQPL